MNVHQKVQERTRFRRLAGSVSAGLAMILAFVPATAIAQAAEAAAETTTGNDVLVARAFAAAIAMAASALAAGYAQARIGSAGAGTLAERPEAATSVLVLLVLPEIIVLLGFVIAFMIASAE